MAPASVKSRTTARGASAPEKAEPRMRKHVDDQGTKVPFAAAGEPVTAACVNASRPKKEESTAATVSATTSRALSARGECAEAGVTVSVRSASANQAGLAKLATARRVQSPAWSRGGRMEASTTVSSVQEMETAGVVNAFVTLLTLGMILETSMWERNVKRTQLERDPAED